MASTSRMRRFACHWWNRYSGSWSELRRRRLATNRSIEHLAQRDAINDAAAHDAPRTLVHHHEHPVRGGVADEGETDHPARAHEKRTEARDQAIRHAEVGDRFRERLRISSWCLTSTDSATTERTPPGPASRATVASRSRTRTARSRTAQSYQDREIRRNLTNLAIRHPQARGFSL